MHDRSADVVDKALFGLVFLNDKTHLPAIEATRNTLPADSPKRRQFDCAITALREGNPFIFSSGFNDMWNAWGLKDSPLKKVAEAAEDEARKAGRPGTCA